MGCVERDDMVEALATDRSDNSLDVRRMPWRAVRSQYLLDAHVLDPCLEERSVDGVPISKQEPRNLVERKRLDDLLSGPTRSWMSRDVEVDDDPALVTQHDKGEEYAKCSGRNGEEVNRDDVPNVVVQESPPRLRWRFVTSDFVLVDCRFGHVLAEQLKLRVNSRCPPCRVLTTHAPDEDAKLGFDHRATHSFRP